MRNHREDDVAGTTSSMEDYSEFARLFETRDDATERAGGHPTQNETIDKKEIVS